MRQIRIGTSLVLTSLLAGLVLPPARADYDAFELPPGVEQTHIPRQLTPGSEFHGANPADVERADHLRIMIERFYAQNKYADAEPLYREYVGVLEKIAPEDSRLATALQNYGDLLRRLHRDEEAAAAESQAQAILSHNDQSIHPYALKQFKLGMTLDEFTRMPSPDPMDRAKASCSCDADQNIENVSDLDKEAKVVQCGFWIAKKDAVSEPYKMTVADISCHPDFRFIQTDDGYRLFEIALTFFSPSFDQMKQALIERYGRPREEKVEKIKTPMGNLLPRISLMWDNGLSKIRLTSMDGENVSRSRLLLVHRQLYLVYARRINEGKDLPGKRAAEDL